MTHQLLVVGSNIKNNKGQTNESSKIELNKIK